MIEGYDPGAVARALKDFHHAFPDFHSNASLQAQLILTWETDFASQVLNTWKPIRQCWIDILGKAEDLNSTVQLMLSVLGPTEARAVVVAAGDLYGGARRIALMQALQLGLNQHGPPGMQNVRNPGPATSKEPRLKTSNDPPSSQPQSTEKLPEDKTAPRSLDKRPPLTSSSNLPSVQPQSKAKLGPSTTDASQPARDWTDENSHPMNQHERVKPSSRPKISLSAPGGFSGMPLLFAADDMKRGLTSVPKSTTKPSPSSDLPNQAPLTEHASPSSPSLPVPTQSRSSKDDRASESESDSRSDLDEAGTSAPKTKPKRNRRRHRSKQPTTLPSPSAPKEGHEKLVAPRGQDIQHKPRPESGSPVSGDDTVGGSHERAFGVRERGGHPVIDDFNQSEGEERERSNDSEGDESNYDRSEHDGDSEEEGDDDQVDGDEDPPLLSPWDWDQERNDALVELWEVEDLIVRDPRSTAPVRANWMYEARKGGTKLV